MSKCTVTILMEINWAGGMGGPVYYTTHYILNDECLDKNFTNWYT